MPSPDVSRALAAGAGVLVTLLTLAGGPSFFPPLSAQTDLDAFMKDVVARRDDNWKKLQQYILDEREELILNGPGGARLWGEQRDYTWFLREGYFVRSPVKFNGATIGEDDRRKAEDEYLRRAQRRDARGRQAGPENAPTDSTGVGALARPDTNDFGTGAPSNVDALIRQTRQPQFVSSSYFLRFKFDEGRYALAGREKFEGRDVLRIEYYPTRLYENDYGRRRGRRGEPPRERSRKDNQQDADLLRLMNKVAIVTLWIEPASHQIVKYTFDNVDFEFLPAAWLVQVDGVKASMTMNQPFAEVWLPKGIDLNVALTLAIGQFTFSQTVAYHDYREANVKTTFAVQ
ncbi:MAG TPA: hypothetical protein VLV86_10955 [Vicinamibacterales bacterium]|nr:hypothetical protein [Vicinamibacterales bacterium]